MISVQCNKLIIVMNFITILQCSTATNTYPANNYTVNNMEAIVEEFQQASQQRIFTSKAEDLTKNWMKKFIVETQLRSSKLEGDHQISRQSRHDDKKKKKKIKKGLHKLFHKLKKMLPKILKYAMGPGMFMLGMAQANFNNFVMHALIMSKMALAAVIMVLVRFLIFKDSHQIVRYYSFGSDTYGDRRNSYNQLLPEQYDTYSYGYKKKKK